MADLILIKGGNGAVPDLQDRELGYRKDEKALYIGTQDGTVVKLCDAADTASIPKMKEDISSIRTDIGGLKTNPSGIFYAVYGETTTEDIAEAYNNGNLVLCRFRDETEYEEYVLFLTGIAHCDEPVVAMCTFSSITYPEIRQVRVHDWNVWEDLGTIV